MWLICDLNSYSSAPTPPNSSQTGQIPWNGTGPNPHFAGVPQPVNLSNSALRSQLELMAQSNPGYQPMAQGQQPQPQPPLNFFPQSVPQPIPQQPSNEQPNHQHRPPQNLSQQEAFIQLRNQQPPQPPQVQPPVMPQQGGMQQQPGPPPGQTPQSVANLHPNQWLQSMSQQFRIPAPDLLLKLRQVPALEREKFDNACKTYFEKQNRSKWPVDTPINLQGQTHAFTLWDLHREVMSSGTFYNVRSKNVNGA